jgi:hypothetical protein
MVTCYFNRQVLIGNNLLLMDFRPNDMVQYLSIFVFTASYFSVILDGKFTGITYGAEMFTPHGIYLFV